MPNRRQAPVSRSYVLSSRWRPDTLDIVLKNLRNFTALKCFPNPRARSLHIRVRPCSVV